MNVSLDLDAGRILKVTLICGMVVMDISPFGMTKVDPSWDLA